MIVHGSRLEWKIGDQLDAGGFGKIYLVDGDQDVVVKLVPKDPGADREFIMDDLSGVRNVMPLLDRGQTEDSWAFVMPRAEMSLHRYLLDQPGNKLDISAALGVLIDIAETLTDLSAKGVVHRDLKPDNVLLLNGRWCTTDFGIARYAEAATAAETRKRAMTPPYAAPEQWRYERASPAADIYALGIVGYEILAGEWPFAGPETEDFRDQHLHGWPSPLPDIPAPVAALLDQCLSKAVGSRPTAADVLGRLQRQASSAPVASGLAALQQANREEVARLVEQARLASESQTEAERRASLLQDAERQIRSIATTLLEAIKAAAPTIEVSGLVAQHLSGDSPTHGWRVRLGTGKLDFEPFRRFEDPPSLPFDVIAWCSLGVTKTQDRYGYRGRSHGLWFCDAKAPGQYRWYETAFMSQPLIGGGTSEFDPFAVDPQSNSARQALFPAVGTSQVAWPFTPVDPGEMDEFVNRWASWLAAAASGALMRPSELPERPIAGSWRQGSPSLRVSSD
jgi:serine/threonine protein kinase